MITIFLDINVILDVWLQREHHQASARTLGLIEEGRIESFVAGYSVSILFYVTRKKVGNEKAKKLIAHLLKKVKVSATDEPTVMAALVTNLQDFEDSLAVAHAVAIRADHIVTRNIKDFTESPVPAILPELFNETYH